MRALRQFAARSARAAVQRSAQRGVAAQPVADQGAGARCALVVRRALVRTTWRSLLPPPLRRAAANCHVTRYSALPFLRSEINRTSCQRASLARSCCAISSRRCVDASFAFTTACAGPCGGCAARSRALRRACAAGAQGVFDFAQDLGIIPEGSLIGALFAVRSPACSAERAPPPAAAQMATIEWTQAPGWAACPISCAPGAARRHAAARPHAPLSTAPAVSRAGAAALASARRCGG